MVVFIIIIIYIFVVVVYYKIYHIGLIRRIFYMTTYSPSSTRSARARDNDWDWGLSGGSLVLAALRWYKSRRSFVLKSTL